MLDFNREKELEALIRIKDGKGSMEGVDDGSMLRLSRFLEENRIDLVSQESLSLRAANDIMLKLGAQLEPFRVVTNETSPWEEKSAAVRLANKMQKSRRNKQWRKRKRRIAEMLVKEREQFDQADQEADEWRAREIAKDIAKRKVSKSSTCDSFEAPQDEASIVENDATREDMEGAAIAYVADILKVPAIFIKAVTNVVDGEPSIVEYWQNLAAVTAALGLAVIEVVDFINGKCLSKLQVFNAFLLLPSGGYMPEKRFR